jgi:hypothetical protein
LVQYLKSNPFIFVDPFGLKSKNWVPGWGNPVPKGTSGAVQGPGGLWYSSKPLPGCSLDDQLMDSVAKAPKKSCTECWDDFNKRKGEILKAVGDGRMGDGVLGAGKGIIVGAIITGVGTGILVAKESTWAGPVGWIGAGIATVGGAGIGFYEGSWRNEGIQRAMNDAHKALDRCRANCTGNKV